MLKFQIDRRIHVTDKLLHNKPFLDWWGNKINLFLAHAQGNYWTVKNRQTNALVKPREILPKELTDKLLDNTEAFLWQRKSAISTLELYGFYLCLLSNANIIHYLQLCIQDWASTSQLRFTLTGVNHKISIISSIMPTRMYFPTL